MNPEPLKELLYKMADDQLILGHRNSEWTGLGPLLEEDIAFSSMAQDKIGHSLALYQLLHELGEPDPDTIAFTRPAEKFRNSVFVELPNGEYDFSLVRHFLFDTAEMLRFEQLSKSAYEPLAQLSQKIRGELRYHTLHANTWIRQLGSATDDSISRMQKSLDAALPYALGLFEESPFESELIAQRLFAGEAQLQEQWWQAINKVLDETELIVPDRTFLSQVHGGRKGSHSEYLQPLLNEMGEVFRIDPTAEW